MVDDAEFAVYKTKTDELEHMIKGNGSPGMYRMAIESGEKLDGLISDVSGLASDMKDVAKKRENRLWEITKMMLPYAAVGLMFYFMKAQ